MLDRNKSRAKAVRRVVHRRGRSGGSGSLSCKTRCDAERGMGNGEWGMGNGCDGWLGDWLCSL